MGDILIEIKKGERPDRLIDEYAFFEGAETNISAKQIVREPMNIWLLKIDYNAVNELSILQSLRNHRSVLTAQLNHLTKPRLDPNDPQFPQQWQYVNDGSVGVVDADIDMDQAWDIATGGMTANGDEIVACIIDDGLDGNHEDFGDNLWFNEAEIPDNGIDDDGNGFIDDYDGYDAYDGSDNVFDGGGHGTPVTGIVGAKGNNEIGVAGINWDVKLMIVQGGGNEAEALAAYAYPYWFRKKYNETNGAEGAFVVTTNASWGIDFGQPADAPLWCSFYDSLGMVGIISCGATINGNQDVDVIGDLPTGCPSDFLLSVTNMNSNDVKVNGAGYGATTIDLGAHGQGTWTTAFGNSYGGFGGTSGASPHVSGVVALAYSVYCTELADLSISDPPSAALFVRDMILNGVDPNESLEGITVTGGRLNAYNTLSMIQTFCSDCPPPFGVVANFVTETQALISWETPDSASMIDVRWSELGAENWDTLFNVSTPVTINDLVTCTEYEVQFRSICQDTMSDFGPSLVIKTDGCCEIPEEFSADVTNDTVTIMWTDKIAASSYILAYKSIDSTEYIELETEDNTLILTDIEICAEYEAQLTMICFSGDTLVSDPISFIAGCGACSTAGYCTGFNLGTFAVWIDSVAIGEELSVTGNDDGYGDYTGKFTFNMRQDAMFDVRLSQQYGPFEPPVHYSIWIDYNQNQEFEDDELAYDSEMADFIAATGVIEVPQEALVGYTRLRVAMRPFDPPTPCPDPDYFRGEVEDYCVYIGPEVFPCDLGFDLMIEDVSMTGATFFWTPLDSAIAYNIRYKPLAEEFEYYSALDTFYEATELMACTDYIVEVRAVCAHDTSAYNQLTFKTACTTSTDDEIAGLNELQVYPNPFKSDVLIQFDLENSLDLAVELYDLAGRAIYRDPSISLPSGTSEIKVDGLDNLAEGMYILRMESGSNQLIRKLIKS